MRALVVIPSFEGGGAERAWLTILQTIPPQRVTVDVARFRTGGVFEADLPAAVRRHHVAARRGDPRVVLRLARLMRRLRPDVTVAVLRYAAVVTLLAARLARTSTRVVVNEQNVPEMEFALHAGAAVKWRVLRALYPRADAVAVLSQGIGDSLVRGAGVPPARLRVIPNPVDLAAARERAAAPCPHPWLSGDGGRVPVVVAAGRLVPQKGFDALLRAFRRLRDRQPARLVVIGAGPLEADLRAQAAHLALAGEVDFPGFVTNPYAYLARAACLALSSRYEGFGNVIVEAMACGTPVVATRCPSGPAEIIADGENGLLVPVDDEAALAAAMARVLAEPATAERLRRGGRARADDYARERIAGEYLALFDQLLDAPLAAARAAS